MSSGKHVVKQATGGAGTADWQTKKMAIRAYAPTERAGLSGTPMPAAELGTGSPSRRSVDAKAL